MTVNMTSAPASRLAASLERSESPDEMTCLQSTVGQSSTLTSDEVAALGLAYRLIDRVYRRHKAKLDAALDGENGGASHAP